MPRQPKSWALATLALAVAVSASAARDGRAAQDAAAPFRLDVTVRDNQGKPVSDLDASQFTVTVDGAPRRVISARYVYRGPGAEAAARGAARTSAADLTRLFDPSRAILVIVDETSFPRGAEKAAASTTDRLLDRFGPADQVALVTAPMPPETLSVSFGDDRAAIRETLARLEGRAVAAEIMARPDDAPIAPVVDPDAAAGAAGSSTTGGETPPPVLKVAEELRKEQAAGDQPLLSSERREHALETLTRLVAGLRIAPGPKTIVFATAGLPEMDRATVTAVRNFLQAAETEASRARATVYVLGLPNAGHPVSWTELEELSAATGGELVRVGRNADQALDRIGLALSSTYSLEVEGAASDRDPRGKAIKVTISRASATARTARRVVVRSDPPFLTVASAAPPAAVGARDLPDEVAAPLARDTGKGRRFEPDPELDTIVARASEYLAGYFREFKNVVAEEDYTQMNMAVRPPEVRRTKSDFLLAMAPDGQSMVPFRDVFEVDGRTIRDREARLKRLFLDASPADAVDAATRVQNEGARYNLVSTRTTINVPTFPLTFLTDPFIRSFQFRRGREETLENVRALRVDFEELGRPTVIRTPAGMDVVSSGSIWIDPLTGRIVKTYLRATRAPGTDDQASLSMEATVSYRRSDTLGLWVPSEMRESYRLRGYSTEGRASYSNFRSFQVTTQQEIKIDKK
jgi:VWFA-related protein